MLASLRQQQESVVNQRLDQRTVSQTVPLVRLVISESKSLLLCSLKIIHRSMLLSSDYHNNPLRTLRLHTRTPRILLGLRISPFHNLRVHQLLTWHHSTNSTRSLKTITNMSAWITLTFCKYPSQQFLYPTTSKAYNSSLASSRNPIRMKPLLEW